MSNHHFVLQIHHSHTSNEWQSISSFWKREEWFAQVSSFIFTECVSLFCQHSSSNFKSLILIRQSQTCHMLPSSICLIDKHRTSTQKMSNFRNFKSVLFLPLLSRSTASRTFAQTYHFRWGFTLFVSRLSSLHSISTLTNFFFRKCDIRRQHDSCSVIVLFRSPQISILTTAPNFFFCSTFISTLFMDRRKKIKESFVIS